MAAFEELGVMPELIRGIEDLEWLLPTPVQSESIPLILGGGDVMVAAETGSGKTGAFALPILQVVHETLTERQGSLPECVLSDQDRDTIFSVGRDGLWGESRSKGWAGARATTGAVSGKLYWEVTPQDSGLCRVGWATRAAAYDIGRDKRSFGFGATGTKSHGGQFLEYGARFGKGDVVGCLLDLGAHTVSYTLNGRDLGVAFALPEHCRGGKQALYPALTLKDAAAAVNFGACPFRAGPPAGFVGIGSAAAAAFVTAAATEEELAAAASAGARTPVAVILEPSKDLARQTHDIVVDMARHLAKPSIRAALLVGGSAPKQARQELAEGVDIVTGTQGRIMDLVESGHLALAGVRFFVLDEADRLLDTEGQDRILKLHQRFPKAGAGTARLQVLMFSATLHSDDVKQFAARVCRHPTLVDLKGKEAVPDTVDHVLVSVDPRADRSWLQSAPEVPTDNVHAFDASGPNLDTPENWSQALKRLKPRVLQRLVDTHKMEQALIFCRTNFDCDNLERFLNSLSGSGKAWSGRKETGKENPYSCAVLGGARRTEERQEALQAFKDGEVRLLICTDLAARGLDISGLPYVVNVTLPDRAEDYIHRVGRVGRAEKLGLAISLVSAVREKVWFCTQKGYKPWLKPRQADVRLNEQGGHALWYDEQALLKGIEARLRQPVQAVNPDLTLPPDIAARVSAPAGSAEAAYGQHREGDTSSKAVSEHLDVLKPAVAELARLETLAQGFFFSRKWKADPMQH